MMDNLTRAMLELCDGLASFGRQVPLRVGDHEFTANLNVLQWLLSALPGLTFGRTSLHDLAVTWQWVHVAHAHLDLSPIWRGWKPTAKDGARYHRFADSVDERQQLELSLALHKRA